MKLAFQQGARQQFRPLCRHTDAALLKFQKFHYKSTSVLLTCRATSRRATSRRAPAINPRRSRRMLVTDPDGPPVFAENSAFGVFLGMDVTPKLWFPESGH